MAGTKVAPRKRRTRVGADEAELRRRWELGLLIVDKRPSAHTEQGGVVAGRNCDARREYHTGPQTRWVRTKLI